MSAVDFIEEARGWASMLVRSEARSSGTPVDDARSSVARKTNVPESIFVSLGKNRLKGLDVRHYFNLRAAVERALQAELRRHEHEIHVLRQAGVDSRDDEFSAAQAGLEACRKALGISD